MSAPLLPRLTIIRQNCPTEDRTTKGGAVRRSHVVIKNSPFILVVGQEPPTPTSRPIDFTGLAIDCTLLYDTEPAKAVDFVRSKPVEFKATSIEHGTQMQIEMRIKVLTSQHEDMFFRVHVQILDSTHRRPIEGLCVRTLPIKVISKPEQLKRRNAGSRPASATPKQPAPKRPQPQRSSAAIATAAATAAAAAAAAVPTAAAAAAPSVVSPGAVSRPPPPSPLPQLQPLQVQPAQLPPSLYQLPRLGDILDFEGAPSDIAPMQQQSQQQQQQQQQAAPRSTTPEQLNPLAEEEDGSLALDQQLAFPPETPSTQQQQQQQRELVDLFAEVLTRIEQRQLMHQHLLEEVHSSSSAKTSALSWTGDGSQQQQKPDFDAAFVALMDAYGRLSSTERAARVRRIVQIATPTQASQVSELVDMFATEGLGRELGREARPPRTFTPQQSGDSMLCGVDDMANLDILGVSGPFAPAM